MSGHTPGPWRLHNRSEFSIVSDSFGVATCGGHSDNTRNSEDLYQEQIANARLIAAAPDLLAALREAYAAMEPMHHLPAVSEALGASRAAIAKATGGEA